MTSGETPELLAVIGTPEEAKDRFIRLGRDSPAPILETALDCQQESPHSSGLKLHPNGKWLAYADVQSGLRVLDIRNGREMMHMGIAHRNRNEAIAWSSNGENLITYARGGETKVWEPVPERSHVRNLLLAEAGKPGGILGVAADFSRVAYIPPGDRTSIWV